MKKVTKTIRKPASPAKTSRVEMPEVDFAKARVRKNHHAARIAKEGITIQVGRGRPQKLAEVGGTSPRSVRFPDAVWRVMEAKAERQGLSLHAALREAILAWVNATA